MFIATLLMAVPAWTVPAPQTEASVTDLLLVVSRGGESLFADPKDQALLRALRLLDDRIAELPGEIPDFPRELALLTPFLSRLVGGPMTLRVGAWENADPALGPPFFLQLTLPEGSPEAAQALANQMTEMLVAGGMPQPQLDEAGRVILPAPLPAWYGVEGDSLKLTLGQADEGELVPGATGLPDGVEPLLAVSLEYGAMMNTFADLAAMSGDLSATQALDMLEQMGLLDMSLQMAYGVDEQLGYTVVSMPGYAAKLRQQGLAPERTLTAADLARVPADAVWANVSAINAGGMVDMYMGILESTLAQQGMTGDPMEMVRAQLGFDPRTDLIDHLGAAGGVFASDTTGGGGCMSIVAFMEVADEAALATTLGKVEDMLNAMAGMHAKGYVRTEDWEDAGVAYTTLAFPGLPVPLELTYAMDGGYLYAGLVPQSVVSAIVHARHGGGGLLNNKRFTGNLAGGMEGLVSVGFMDTPRLIAGGYSAAVLLGSALRNGTRSPQDESRDAGMIIPSFPVLVSGAKATVTATRHAGDDVVSESRGDRSMVVGLAGAAGALGTSPLLPIIAAAVALPAAVESRNRALEPRWEEIEPTSEDSDEDY